MTTLILNSQFKQFDLNGEPLAAGKVYTYEVGTTTPKTTYQDEDKVAAHTNPIILDSFGEETIYISGDTKLVVKDSNDVDIRTYPIFEDSAGASLNTPVIPSPNGAVYRSTSVDVGYIKIVLPVTSYPNTKMSFDVVVYEDVDDSTFKVSVAGYANSTGDTWENVTAKTTGSSDINVRFGSDGTNIAVYIGESTDSWTRPQIAVQNFFPGQFVYDWTTWQAGWDIVITSTLGTITDTASATADSDGVSAWTEVTTYETDFQGLTGEKLAYRTVNYGKTIQLTGAVERTGGGTGLRDVCTLPSGFRPYRKLVFFAGTSQGDFATTLGTSRSYILTDGTINVSISDDTTWYKYITVEFPAA